MTMARKTATRGAWMARRGETSFLSCTRQPGNHDYEDALRIPGSIPFYFNYVLNGGERSRGWQAFDWGGWRIIGLNSEIMERDESTSRLSALGREQMAWFDRELQQWNSRDRCVLTAYHRPMFSSGRFASPSWVGPIFG